MSLLGFGQTGFSLKDLLENPVLQNPPQLGRDGGDVKQKEKGSSSPGFDPTSAFLGPNLWSSNYSEADVSLEYMDLDEFLSENGIPVDLNDNSNGSSKSDKDVSKQGMSPKSSDVERTTPLTECTSVLSDLPLSPTSTAEESIIKEEVAECGSPLNLNIEYKVTEQEVALATVPGEETFDPKARKFSEDELKPQPMIKKSRKVLVPDEQKDDKYWARRKKNNVAAKRSRDARRVKENQIAMRACYLEKCNQTLTEEVQKLKKENAQLKKSFEESQQKLKAANLL